MISILRTKIDILSDSGDCGCTCTKTDTYNFFFKNWQNKSVRTLDLFSIGLILNKYYIRLFYLMNTSTKNSLFVKSCSNTTTEYWGSLLLKKVIHLKERGPIHVILYEAALFIILFMFSSRVCLSIQKIIIDKNINN